MEPGILEVQERPPNDGPGFADPSPTCLNSIRVNPCPSVVSSASFRLRLLRASLATPDSDDQTSGSQSCESQRARLGDRHQEATDLAATDS